jgi:lysophospholipase L1-like esterase
MGIEQRMARILTALALGALVLAVACSGGEGGSPTATPQPSPTATPAAIATPQPTATPTPALSPTPAPTTITTSEVAPTPSPTPTAAATPTPTSALQASTVAYLSLGDSIQYGCCGDPVRSSGELFRQYLSDRLDRPVEWLTLADNGTAQSFIHGGYGSGPQLDRAVALLDDLRSQGEPVAAITMCIGGNDFLFLEDPEDGHPCHTEGSPGCLQAFLDMLERYEGQLDLILATLTEAKEPHTPLLLLNYYDAWDYGEITPEYMATEPGLVLINQVMAEAAARYEGVFLVDIYPLFKGKAREYISGVDPTYEGHAVIAEAYREVYETLPPQFVQPFEGGAPTQ